jgi:hypothetical protein
MQCFRSCLAAFAEGISQIPTCSSASPPWWTTACFTPPARLPSPPALAPPANWCCTCAAEEREAIFGRIVRGSASLASPRRGSGIGLSVVRLLIEPMGGRVQVVDHPGGGADFQLLLPRLANP